VKEYFEHEHHREKAVRGAAGSGSLSDSGKLQARMTLTIPELGLEHVIDHEIDTGQ
jgi:hypothetical protein